MFSPIPHDLTIYDDQFDFKKNGFCPHQWEISVPQKNCIIWGVVLSYLRTADFAVPGKFEERLKRLTDNDFDPENVKFSILDFNPFFNIHKCFFDETLQNVTQSFRKVLNKNRSPKAPKSVPNDMKLIATLLKSNILIVDLANKSLHLVTPSDGCAEELAAITVVCREYWTKDSKKPVLMKRFTYSLNKDLCWDLRLKAFKIILESSEIRDIAEKEIQTLSEKKEKRVNILIAFLKKNLTHEISQLYDSSYNAAKLADAGFETDPRVLDSEGFSAFYYAFQANDKSLVYILYRYAANNCYESMNTFRDPNPSIISYLSKVGEVLKGDCSRSNNFESLGEKSEQAKVAYQDLLRFNEFLTRVGQGINSIWEKPEDSFLKLAEKQKEIISIILKEYDTFFSIEQLESEEKLIENYTKHKTYYDNLDFTVALLFFDNIYLLKSSVKSPYKGFYLDVESSFLLLAVTTKYFSADAKKVLKIQDLGFESDSFNLSIISVLERLTLREKIRKFCSILGEKKLDEVDCLPCHEISKSLSYFQELKDEFFISCLEYYLKTALETKPEGLKQKFVIQRALLVIGESININEEDSSSIRHFLRKCLPDDTLEVLKKAQNTLSRLQSSQFPLKFEAEKDDVLFTSIHSEIRSIKKAFDRIFDLQRLRLKKFLISRGLELVDKLQKNKSVDIQPQIEPMKSLKEELQKSITELERILDHKGADGNLVVPNIGEFYRRLTSCASKGINKENLVNISEIPCGNNLTNLLNRIQHLFEISIDEQSDVRFLWEKAKSSKAKQHLVYKIVQRSFREPPFQASLEMLLFDCVVIFKHNQDFKSFWLKDSLLFNGIDLRDVLAFDEPLLESIGYVLDPKDLPSELVRKMLQLFEDRECIKALCDLWQKEKLPDKISDNSSEWYRMKDPIVCCPRWQEYSKLLAEDSKDFEILKSLVSFLVNVTEPKGMKKY